MIELMIRNYNNLTFEKEVDQIDKTRNPNAVIEEFSDAENSALQESPLGTLSDAGKSIVPKEAPRMLAPN